MAVTNELAFPETEERFEEMCFNLYRLEWQDPGCARLGGTGQKQYGLDIIGTSGSKQIGVQCKHYVKTDFTLRTIEKDVEKADMAGVAVDHLIFATTAPSKATLVLQIRALSESRKNAGKFTVSVAFWQDLSGMLRLKPDVAREYIPGFPGGVVLQVLETTEATLAIVQSSSEQDAVFRSDVLGKLEGISDRVASASAASNLPQAQGTEAEPLIANNLDIVRGKVLDGRPKEALELLKSLGNPDRFRDTYSQFRWHTNHAAALLLEGKRVEAAREYLVAASVDTTLEKAFSNRAHAYLLLDDAKSSLAASTEGLSRYPESGPLWALHVAAKQVSGDAEPERDVPKHIRDTADVRFTLSHVRYKQGRLEESLDLIRLCVEVDAPSLELRRSYLASALSWATSNPAAARHDQLLPKQREALADAIRRIEPLEPTLASLQLNDISEELNSNACTALVLVGDLTRAQALAAAALNRHPNLEGLLRVRVNELIDHDDFAGLHSLTDSRLTELPASTLAALAEVSANKGDMDWHKSVMAVLNLRPQDARQAAELGAITIHATWSSGNKADAIRLAEEFLRQQPGHVPTRVLLSRMLMNGGELMPATQQADLAFAALRPDSPVEDVLYLADLLFERKLYPRASALYERVATLPGPNALTQRHLTCLIESGQRRKASDILESLAPEVRSLPVFRRIESNLARQMGDWPRMRDVLKQELDRVPSDSGIAVGYIGALHRIAGEKETLKAYLESDPVYDGRLPFNEIEVAKYQREHGFRELALKRMYRLFRAHPNDSAIGGYFLAQVIIGEQVPELQAPRTVQAGTTVHLSAGAEKREVAIDVDESCSVGTWPELVSPDSELGKALTGKYAGDRISLPRGIGDVEYEILGISSIYAFAIAKVHKLLAETANPGGPLWSVNLEGVDGSLDIEPLLSMARRKSARIADALKSYSLQRFPLATLAQLVGTEPLTLMLDWPGSKASLFVNIGTHEERQSALAELNKGSRRFVIDLSTVGELVGSGVFRSVVPLLGKPLVSQTAREELVNILQFQETLPSSMSIREENGQYIREEATAEQLSRRLALLREMLACMDELCEVTPVLGPKDITDAHRILDGLLDAATLDSVYLALEREAILLSDDGGLRLLAPSVGLNDTMAIQPLLMFARDRGALSDTDYVDVVMGKVARKHDFISLRTEDLLTVARRDTTRVAAGVVAALETFRKPGLELNSGVQVCGEFLASIVPLCPPSVTKEYFQLALAALQHERPKLAEAIHSALADAIEHGMESVSKKRVGPLKRAFGALLAPPVASPQRIHPTPVARAVWELVLTIESVSRDSL